jgi:hypothetical protein
LSGSATQRRRQHDRAEHNPQTGKPRAFHRRLVERLRPGRFEHGRPQVMLSQDASRNLSITSHGLGEVKLQVRNISGVSQTRVDDKSKPPESLFPALRSWCQHSRYGESQTG